MNRNIYPRGYNRSISNSVSQSTYQPSASNLTAIGEEYEHFIGVYFEITEKCDVFYNGKALGVKDGGIDLIAVSTHTTFLIQCKNYSTHNIVREDVIHQISGCVNTFKARFPDAHNVVAVVATTSSFSEEAVFAAKVNNVELRKIKYQKKYKDGQIVLYNSEVSTEGHRSITYDICTAENHERVIQTIIYKKQLEKWIYEDNVAPRSPSVEKVPESINPAFANQTPVIPYQAAPKAEQTPVIPNQTAPKTEQTPVIPNQTAPKTEQTSTASNISNQHQEEQGIPLLPFEVKKTWWASRSDEFKEAISPFLFAACGLIYLDLGIVLRDLTNLSFRNFILLSITSLIIIVFAVRLKRKKKEQIIHILKASFDEFKAFL